MTASDRDNGLFVLRLPIGLVAGEPAPPPVGFALAAPAPNPTTGATRLALTVGEAQAIRAETLGRHVAVVLAGTVLAGTTALASDAPALPAAPHLLRVVGQTFTTTARVSVAR